MRSTARFLTFWALHGAFYFINWQCYCWYFWSLILNRKLFISPDRPVLFISFRGFLLILPWPWDSRIDMWFARAWTLAQKETTIRDKCSWLPITGTFKGNRRKFELSGIRVIGSRKKIAGSKVKNSFYCTVNILITLYCWNVEWKLKDTLRLKIRT